MCGICGIVNADADPGMQRSIVEQMTADLARRGPDDSGTWTAATGQASLGFRRLAIIDPTPAGAQPMWSRDGDAVLVFNGEIYNYQDLGRTLERHGARFDTSSDTEVLLEALRRWGPDALPRLRGMFSLALFRPKDRTLLLARDHAGMKPLFIARQPEGPGLAFASRYDTLFRTGWLDGDDYEPAALAAYVERRHVPGPAGLHRGAGQVAPGEWLLAGAEGVRHREIWWHLEESAEPALRGGEATEALGEALDRSVRRHLISDVPIGVFLSGGIDSPLVAGTATAVGGRRFEGFTIGFPGWHLDESATAARMAGPLDIEHRVHNVTTLGADAIEATAAAQDEPLNDWSIIPTLLVSELARRSVTVALSGDGGDELFFGYSRSRSVTDARRLWPLPRPVRRAVAKARRATGQRVSSAAEHRNPTAYYDAMQAVSPDPMLDLVAPGLAPHRHRLRAAGHEGPSSLRALAAFSRQREFTVQLPRVLRKVDQASMHHGLEVRVPLLDPDVIAVAMRIDPAWSFAQPASKPALRSLLRRRLGHDPPEAKLGFGAPMARWMADELREPIDEALRNDLGAPNVFEPTAIRRCWDDQISGRADHRALLWGLASLSWWRRRVRAMTPPDRVVR